MADISAYHFEPIHSNSAVKGGIVLKSGKPYNVHCLNRKSLDNS